MVAQQCDLNMLNMVTFISNVMPLYCLLFWRLPISLSEIYQCSPWPTWPCIIYIHAITAAITLPSLIYLLCSSYTGLAIKLSSYAFGCVCVCVCVCTQLLSRVELFATSRAVAHQAPLCMGFYWQESWSGLPFTPPGDLPHPGINLNFSALQQILLPLSHWGSPCILWY